jgi:hypothetical protein
MGDFSEIYRCRPDGQLCDQNFRDFCWKSFLFENRVRTVRHSRLEGRTSTASNFHIRASRPRGMAVQTVTLQHAISISDEHAFGPSWLSSERLYLNCDSCLMYERVQMGIHVVWTVASIFPYLNLERKSEADRSLDVIRMGCWVVWTDASWNRSFSIQWRVRTEIHVVQMNDAWSVWRPDGWNCGQMSVRTGWHIVRMADREPILLTCNQCRISEILLNSGLPVNSIFTYKWFCPKQNEANHKLTEFVYMFRGSKSCKNWFRGCHCAKSQCRSRQCPYFAAGRECDQMFVEIVGLGN